jgi:hypothetical protein
MDGKVKRQGGFSPFRKLIAGCIGEAAVESGFKAPLAGSQWGCERGRQELARLSQALEFNQESSRALSQAERLAREIGCENRCSALANPFEVQLAAELCDEGVPPVWSG